MGQEVSKIQQEIFAEKLYEPATWCRRVERPGCRQRLLTQAKGPECLQKQAKEPRNQCTGANGPDTVCKEAGWAEESLQVNKCIRKSVKKSL